MLHQIDHIVLACKDLESYTTYVSNKLGAPIVGGGQHLDMGTHNKLIKIGEDCYLEIIAADPNNPNQYKAWMAVNQIENPTITRYALSTDSIADDIKHLTPFYGTEMPIHQGSRLKKDGSTLSWTMSLPSNSSVIDDCPFLLDWSQQIHPMSPHKEKCQLVQLKIYSP